MGTKTQTALECALGAHQITPKLALDPPKNAFLRDVFKKEG